MFRHHTMRLLLGLLALLLAAAAPAGTRVTYYHLDAAGTPVAATDQNGELLWRTGHLPYGQPTGAIPGRIGYAGHVVDDTGLIYMGARYYDPVAGRFMGMDPAGFDETNPQSFNRYQYANNNPYRYVDPDGESPIDVFFLAADMIKLGAAIYSGNASAVVESSLDVAASVVGVLSPVPGVGQAIKAGRRAGLLANALPGPTLDKRTAATFANGIYLNRKLARDETLYKYHGVSNRTGRKISFLTSSRFESQEQARSALAIRRDWGVDITRITEFRVPGGTWMSEGRAAAQGTGYPGGGNQAVISNVPRSWIVRTDRLQ